MVERTVIKNREAAHEWLRCIADNAITASIVEEGMGQFIKRFRRDKKKIYDKLRATRELYLAQCNELMTTLNTFCEGVVEQATDHVCRERLVARAFTIYLTELQTRRPEGRDDAREIMAIDQHCAKRAERSEKTTIRRRLRLMSAFDTKRVDLCRQVQEQFEAANEKLLSNLRTRDSEIEGYLADINYTFRRFVQHSCNRRRQLHTINIVKRKNFFRFEDECLSEIGSLLSNLRLNMEAAWRDEHMRCTTIMKGAQSRMRELIGDCEGRMKHTYENLSCNLKGDRSNIAWVSDAEKVLDMKESERLFSIKQLRRKVDLEWVELLRGGIQKIIGIVKEASLLPTPDASSVDNDVMWAAAFATFGAECTSIVMTFRESIESRLEKERSVLTTTCAGQIDYLESNWKENIVTMNKTLLAEMKGFFQLYCDAKDSILGMSLEQEIEALCYEQSSLVRLSKFWEGVNGSNRIFADELRETLRVLVEQMSEQSGTRKVLPYESEKFHFSLLGGRAYDVQDFGDKYYTREHNVAGGSGAHLIDMDMQSFDSRDVKRSGLLAALQFDKIDVEKLFEAEGSTGRCTGIGEGTGESISACGADHKPISPPPPLAEGAHHLMDPSDTSSLPVFKSVNEALRYCVESIQLSRIRMLLKHTKSELQSLDTTETVTMSQKPEDRLHVFNRCSFDYMGLSERGGFPRFTAMASLALSRLMQQSFKFCESSKLLNILLQALRVEAPLEDHHRQSLMNVFSMSFAMNITSQMAQCNQRVDCQQIYEYMRRNIRQVCLASLHATAIALQQLILPRTQPTATEDEKSNAPHAGSVDNESQLLLRAEGHIGLEEMLCCESSWLLAVLDIDEDFPGSALTANDWLVATKKTIAALQEQTPDEIRTHRMKQRRHVNLLRLSDDCVAFLRSKELERPAMYSSMHRMTSSTDTIQRHMRIMGVPDPDVCVLSAFLSDACTNGDQLMDLTVETIRAAVRLWRFVAYCKLHTLSQMMHDLDEKVEEVSPQSVTVDRVHEYDSLSTVLRSHDVFTRQQNEIYDNGEFKIASISPFDAVGAVVMRITAITDVPLSYLQVLSFLADRGGLFCEPWITEPTTFVGQAQFAPLSSEIARFLDFGMLWGFVQRIQDMQSCTSSSAALAPLFSDRTFDEMTLLNSGSAHQPIPLEVLRHYCSKSRGDGRTFTTIQITMRFWAAYRADEVHCLRDEDTISVAEFSSRADDKTCALRGNEVVSMEPSRHRSVLPDNLLEGLPKTSLEEEVEEILSKNTKSVVELLEMGDTVDSFTDTIGNISDPSSSFLASSFYEATGLLQKPLPSAQQRALLATATQHFPDILHPFQAAACIWILNHTPVQVERIKSMIALARPQLRTANATPPHKVSDTATQNYPSLSEIRRRVELSLLMQYCGGDCYDTKQGLLLVPYGDGSNEATGGIAEYWKQLSRNRLTRVGSFTSSARELHSDYWSEYILECRTERHHDRVAAQQELFSKFRQYVKAYRMETLRQREVLKELYGYIKGQMITQQSISTQMLADIGNFFNFCADNFERILHVTLEGYGQSKVAYLKQNFAVYSNHRAMLTRVYTRCRNALLSLMHGQRDRFGEQVLRNVQSYVRASATVGYAMFQRAAGK